MAKLFRKPLPENCVQCGKVERGTCPFHMGERQEIYLSHMLVRGIRKYIPVEGRLAGGWSMMPTVVVIVPTLRCNLACDYCFQRIKNPSDRSDNAETRLNLDAWKSLIDELKPVGIPVIVMGGELFLYHEIIGLLQCIREANLPLSIITNGFDLKSFTEELVDIGVSNIIISIDGPREIHNQVRNHPHSYQRAIEGIGEVISSRGVCASPRIEVSCTISNLTQSHLREFADTMCSMGVDRIVFNNLIYATPAQIQAQEAFLKGKYGINHSGWNSAGYNYSQVDWGLISNELRTIRSERWSDKVFVMPPGVEQNFAAYYAPQAAHFTNQFCSAIYREAWVLPNGDVAACSHLNHLVMGNIREAGLMKVWNNQYFRSFRQSLAEGLLPACGRCEKLTYFHPDGLITY